MSKVEVSPWPRFNATKLERMVGVGASHEEVARPRRPIAVQTKARMRVEDARLDLLTSQGTTMSV